MVYIYVLYGVWMCISMISQVEKDDMAVYNVSMQTNIHNKNTCDERIGIGRKRMVVSLKCQRLTFEKFHIHSHLSPKRISGWVFGARPGHTSIGAITNWKHKQSERERKREE